MERRIGAVSFLAGIIILGFAGWFIAGGHTAFRFGPTPSVSPTPTVTVTETALPPCTRTAPATLPLRGKWIEIVTAYYAKRNLSITSIDPAVAPLDVESETQGLHVCANANGTRGAWTGSVPANAMAAVRIGVTHAPYAVTGTAFNFLTLAELPEGWAVVDEGTSP